MQAKISYNLPMKYIWIVILSLMFLSGLIYVIPSTRAKATQLLSYSTCDSPLSYRLGSIDDRFGLTNEEVLSDIDEAATIWDSAKGKKLFAYSAKAPLTINFVYDQRQQLDNSISQLTTQLQQTNSSLKQQIAQYKSDLSAFEKKLADFNATVDSYNAKGGAPKDVYDQLKQEQQELKVEGDALNARAKDLNLSANDFNSGVSNLNSQIGEFNNDIAQKPEQGLYNEGDNTITIYFAENHTELIHTLAHELGHALGMMHVADKDAIMNANTNPSITPTADDLTELSTACREQSIVYHELHVIGLWLNLSMIHLSHSLAKK